MSDAFYLGVDPGQAIDPTGIAIVQRIADPNGSGKPLFHCVHLRRLPLDTPYPGIVQYVRRLLSEPPCDKPETHANICGCI